MRQIQWGNQDQRDRRTVAICFRHEYRNVRHIMDNAAIQEINLSTAAKICQQMSLVCLWRRNWTKSCRSFLTKPLKSCRVILRYYDLHWTSERNVAEYGQHRSGAGFWRYMVSCHQWLWSYDTWRWKENVWLKGNTGCLWTQKDKNIGKTNNLFRRSNLLSLV